jgi:hypothetical protein
MKAYDGSLELSERDFWLVLKNAKGHQIGCRYLQKSENISLGAKFRFPLHVVRIGLPIQYVAKPVPPRLLSVDVIPDKVVSTTMPGSSSTSEVDVSSDKIVSTDMVHHDMNKEDLSMSVYDSISLGLDFSHGMHFAKEIRSFNLDVHPSGESGHFIMVVSFGRSRFRLSEDSVGSALESSLGGFCDNFKVSALSERVFSFCVSSKKIGF